MVTVDSLLKRSTKAFSEVWRILKDTGVFVIAFLDKATSLGALYELNKDFHKSYKDANFQSAEKISSLPEKTVFI